MGLHVTKTVLNAGKVIWQKVLETVRGGFRLDTTGLTDGATIPGGSLFTFDESTRVARLIKTATLQAPATASATTYRVLKGHLFAIGDNIAHTLGGTAYPITAIDKTNADYDEITVGTTLAGTPAAGAALFQSTATGASAATAEPNGLLYEDTDVSSHADVAIVSRGTVYARRIPGVPVTLRAKLPLIIFSESF